MRSLGLALIQCEWRPCEKGSLTTDANTERTPCADEGQALGDASTSSRRQHQSCQQAPEARGGRSMLPSSLGRLCLLTPSSQTPDLQQERLHISASPACDTWLPRPSERKSWARQWCATRLKGGRKKEGMEGRKRRPKFSLISNVIQPKLPNVT